MCASVWTRTLKFRAVDKRRGVQWSAGDQRSLNKLEMCTGLWKLPGSRTPWGYVALSII